MKSSSSGRVHAIEGASKTDTGKKVLFYDLVIEMGCKTRPRKTGGVTVVLQHPSNASTINKKFEWFD